MLRDAVYVFCLSLAGLVLAAAPQADSSSGEHALARDVPTPQDVWTVYHQGRVDSALAMATESLAAAEERYGSQHPEVGTWLNRAAKLNVELQAYGEARRLFERAITVFEPFPGEGQRRLADALESLAWMHERQGALDSAEYYSRRAVEIGRGPKRGPPVLVTKRSTSEPSFGPVRNSPQAAIRPRFGSQTRYARGGGGCVRI